MAATGSLRRIIYGPEATFGAGLATAKILMNTGDSLNLTKTTSQSASLTGDRSIRSIRHGSEAVGGDISFELAFADFNDILAGVMCSTWDATVPTAPVLIQGNTPANFAIEKGFTDINQYIEYIGCNINTLAISMSTDAIVTGTIGIIGAGTTDGYVGATVVASPTAPAYSEPFVSFDGAILLGGSDACGVMTGLDFTIDNGITANYALCTTEAVSMTPDRFNVTGTITMLFEDAVELNKFLAEGTSSLSVEFTDEVGNKLKFELPKIKYTGGDVPVSGGGVVPVSLPFQALYDTATLTTVKITSTPFVGP